MRTVSTGAAAPKKCPDWQKIKAEYDGGRKSIRELARTYGLSDTAIRKHARREGWKAAAPEPAPSAASAPGVPDPAALIAKLLGELDAAADLTLAARTKILRDIGAAARAFGGSGPAPAKKEAAQRDAAAIVAGEDPGWGDDLALPERLN